MKRSSLSSVQSWVLPLLLVIAGACAAHDNSDGSDPFGGAASPATADAGHVSPGATGGTAGLAGAIAGGTVGAGAAAGTTGAGSTAGVGGSSPNIDPKCAATSLDQQGCPCAAVGSTRPCYAAPLATRNVGVCRDGVQTCKSTGATSEFDVLRYGACEGMVVPAAKSCSIELDAHCTGLVGCEDPLCASELKCGSDAGMPDAGNPCFMVSGQNGNITINGTMFCEGDSTGSGGFLGGLFGGGTGGP